MARVRVGAGVPLGAGPRHGERLVGDGAGGRLLLAPPQRRRWAGQAALLAATDVGWRIETDGEGHVLRAADPQAEVDLLVMSGAATTAALREPEPAPLTVIGSFESVGGPEDLGRFLVGGQVLDTNVFSDARRPSEQVALSLYRIARHRGGPFWNGLATWLAGWVRHRVDTAPGGLMVHGGYGFGETHMRFLADAALLLQAEAQRGGDPTVRAGAERATDAVESLSVVWNGGRWLRHDTLERDRGELVLVLNTHLQAVLAILAAGRDVTAYLAAADHALRLRPDRSAAVMSAASALTAIVANRGPRRVGAPVARTCQRLHRRAMAGQRRRAFLMTRDGWIARDVSGEPLPHYFTVNLHDLAGVHRNHPTPASSAALRRGLRHAWVTGFVSGRLRAADTTVVLVPIALRNAGRPRAAARWAQRIAAEGIAPAIGWPDITDRLWSGLAAGTP